MLDNYMKDPRAKTLEGFIVALQIFSKYTEKGLQESFALQGEHDVIYIWVEKDQVSKEDAVLLVSLGWHVDEDGPNWAYFT
jgi:hypothetical protein